MRDLVGKIVEVETPEVTYVGTLVEIGEDEVHLQSETGWIVIPMDRVMAINSKEG